MALLYFWLGLILAFIILKLAQVGMVAAWSWWWVLAPAWIPFALLLIGVAVYYVATYGDKTDNDAYNYWL